MRAPLLSPRVQAKPSWSRVESLLETSDRAWVDPRGVRYHRSREMLH